MRLTMYRHVIFFLHSAVNADPVAMNIDEVKGLDVTTEALIQLSQESFTKSYQCSVRLPASQQLLLNVTTVGGTCGKLLQRVQLSMNPQTPAGVNSGGLYYDITDCSNSDRYLTLQYDGEDEAVNCTEVQFHIIGRT